MIAFFLTLLTLTAAHPDPATLFETIEMPEQDIAGRSAIDGIQNVLQEQGIVLAEATFDSTLAKSSCLAREMCQFGANEEARFNPFGQEVTIGNAIDIVSVSINSYLSAIL